MDTGCQTQLQVNKRTKVQLICKIFLYANKKISSHKVYIMFLSSIKLKPHTWHCTIKPWGAWLTLALCLYVGPVTECPLGARIAVFGACPQRAEVPRGAILRGHHSMAWHPVIRSCLYWVTVATRERNQLLLSLAGILLIMNDGLVFVICHLLVTLRLKIK